MSLEEQINKDYIQAMKDRNALKSAVVNFLRAQIKNVHINEKKPVLEEAEVIAVIKKQIKQRQDSIEQFKQGGRNDLVEKESAELAILKSYLPEEMSEEGIRAAILTAVEQTGAKSMKDMGAVIKAVLGKVQGKADGKLVSELVKKVLSDL